jgi:hypothetical protein
LAVVLIAARRQRAPEAVVPTAVEMQPPEGQAGLLMTALVASSVAITALQGIYSMAMAGVPRDGVGGDIVVGVETSSAK